MNTYSTIPITHIRDKVKAFYDIVDTKKDVMIDLFIVAAANEIGSYLNTTGCTITLDICDNKAEVPCNFKTLVQIVSDCVDENGDNYYYDNFRFNGNCMWESNAKRFKIQNGYIIFPSNIEATQVDMYYIGYNIDDNGFIILMKAHEAYYFRYALYWFGLHISDARYKEFKNYPRIRMNTTHNEQVDIFNYEKLQIAAITKSIGSAGRIYRGFFNNITPILIG
jgi:hypothetical protein